MPCEIEDDNVVVDDNVVNDESIVGVGVEMDDVFDVYVGNDDEFGNIGVDDFVVGIAVVIGYETGVDVKGLEHLVMVGSLQSTRGDLLSCELQ